MKFYLKQLPVLLLLLLIQSPESNAQITNSSYTNNAGEKVLQLEMVIPVNRTVAWQYFTADSLLRMWIAPVAHVEARTGGYIVTNYDKTKPLSDKTSITCEISSLLEKELLILKVRLNDNFSKELIGHDEHLQEVIQFVDLGNGSSKIISSMIGWGTGKEWEKTYQFFVRGNEWTYKELLKLFPSNN